MHAVCRWIGLLWLVCLGGASCQPSGQNSGLDGGDGGEDSGPRALRAEVLLGQGGFFGVSGVALGAIHGPGTHFAVGAHYADLTDGQADPLQAGRVYLFAADGIPSAADQAGLVLEPPDRAELGGFGYTIAQPCDLDGDGRLDLPIGNHLFSPAAAPNSGRVVVFSSGPDGRLDPQRYTQHRLPDDLRRASDVLGQSVLCADFDQDGFGDLLAAGQNAGSDDTGLAAIYPGGPGGPAELPDRVLVPPLASNRQYFGASALWADLDADGAEDLAIGGWGLVRDQVQGEPHTGGLLVFAGGTDWSLGPAFGLYPPGDLPVNAGSELAIVGPPSRRCLAVGAPDFGAAVPDDPNAPGGVLLYEIGPGIRSSVAFQVLVPPARFNGGGFGQALAWVPDYFGAGQGALLVGMKYADASPERTGTGAVAVFEMDPTGQGFLAEPEILLAPDPLGNDGFGGAIVPLGDLDGDGLGDFFVGIESHIEGDIYTGFQTGGVILFH